MDFELLSNGLLAGVLGLAGQLFRVAVGLKKALDSRPAGVPIDVDLVDVARLVLSLVLGFMAGVASWGVLSLAAGAAVPPLRGFESAAALATDGYAGADFIEGLIRRKAA